MLDEYSAFLDRKSHLGSMDGFEPIWIPDSMFDFQKTLVDWNIRKGRSADFADCGLGKTLIQLVWAENIWRHTQRPVLILTPLAVSHQTVTEAAKFGIDASRSQDGMVYPITITNYERLAKFNSTDFVGCVLDESSILKSFDGVRRGEITHFMRKLPYRLLCTATAAPNDYVELGTSSEALGELGHMDMLSRFFKNENSTIDTKGRYRGFHAPRVFEGQKWRFKGHAELPFWRWVCSWARSIRKPSDLGFNDGPFKLPPLYEQHHLVESKSLPSGMLFALPARGLKEQREERRRTIRERCEAAASLVLNHEQSLIWCQLNDEGDILESLIPDCVQIAGTDSDEAKEEAFIAFASGKLKRLITKHKIAAWGLNFQACDHIVTFPSHSYEQYYQGVRRCWRFGQTRPVTVDIVATEGDRSVMDSMLRKSAAADAMFERLIAQMNNVLQISRPKTIGSESMEVPSWIR